MQVDVSESGQGGRHAAQLVFKSFSFLLEFADYRLHECFWHEEILSLPNWPKGRPRAITVFYFERASYDVFDR